MKTYRKLIDRGRITQPITFEMLEASNQRILREQTEKEERLACQRDQNRKRLFPKLWAEEQAAKH